MIRWRHLANSKVTATKAASLSWLLLQSLSQTIKHYILRIINLTLRSNWHIFYRHLRKDPNNKKI
ncbi:hypothetical protein PF008_g8732 [Phytophthora fragariae]|uniref:Uncharacterized protein n=1 Tax=Phytophthora fragariae TaxID=53985 RepID=A0A6G0RZP9_9STRA|nr:hypothetical protein PF008_g8732 [Phytophthora fragariae]